MLPNESATIAGVRLWWKPFLDLLKKSVNLGCEAHRALHVGRGDEVAIPGGVLVKQVKLARALHAVAELGLHHESEVLLRAMLEGAIAMAFLTPEHVDLSVRKIATEKPRHKVKTDRRLRARLFAAHIAFDQQKLVEAYAGMPHGQQLSADLASSMRDTVDAAARSIGPEWTATLKGSGTYSGLDLKALVDLLQVQEFYTGVYKQLSHPTHALDAFPNAALRGEDSARRLAGLIHETGSSLRLGIPVLCRTVEYVNVAFGLGLGDNIAAQLRHFNRAVKEVEVSL